MFRTLRVLFAGILILMLGVTVWASLQTNVMEGFAYLFRDRWGIATLADATCGFLTFYAWVFYKQNTWTSRILWFVAIITLGNIAMAFYMLLVLAKLPANARAEDLLLKRTA